MSTYVNMESQHVKAAPHANESAQQQSKSARTQVTHGMARPARHVPTKWPMLSPTNPTVFAACAAPINFDLGQRRRGR